MFFFFLNQSFLKKKPNGAKIYLKLFRADTQFVIASTQVVTVFRLADMGVDIICKYIYTQN